MKSRTFTYRFLAILLGVLACFETPSVAGTLDSDLSNLVQQLRPFNDFSLPFPAPLWNSVVGCDSFGSSRWFNPKYSSIQGHTDAYISTFLAASSYGTVATMEALCTATKFHKDISDTLRNPKELLESAFREFANDALERRAELERTSESAVALRNVFGLVLSGNSRFNAAQKAAFSSFADVSLRMRLTSIQSDLAELKGERAAPGKTVRLPIVPTVGPFSQVVRVLSKNASCTGAFVGPRIVLTAAHCVSDDSGEPRPVESLVVRRDLMVTEETFTVQGWWTSSGRNGGWSGARRHDFSDDWAILETVETRRDADKYLRVPAEIAPEELQRSLLMVAGYSGDVNRGQLLTLDAGCRISKVLSANINYECSGYKGSSGAPLLVTHDMRVLVGINVCSVGADSANPNLTALARYEKCAVRVERFAEKVKSLLIQQGGPVDSIAFLGPDAMLNQIQLKAREAASTIVLPDWKN